MTIFTARRTTRFIDFAALALAALPIVALSTPTHAQNASVPYVAQHPRFRPQPG